MDALSQKLMQPDHTTAECTRTPSGVLVAERHQHCNSSQQLSNKGALT
jgi:hypothetical protein